MVMLSIDKLYVIKGFEISTSTYSPTYESLLSSIEYKMDEEIASLIQEVKPLTISKFCQSNKESYVHWSVNEKQTLKKFSRPLRTISACITDTLGGTTVYHP